MSRFTYRQLLVVGTVLAGLATAPMYGEAEEFEQPVDDLLMMTHESQTNESQMKVRKGAITVKETKVVARSTKVVVATTEPTEVQSVNENMIETEEIEKSTAQVDAVYEVEEQVFEETVLANVEEAGAEIVHASTKASKTANLVAAENEAQLAKVDPTNEKTKSIVAADYGQTIGELFTDPNFATGIASLLGVEDVHVLLTEEMANSLTRIDLQGKQISNIGATRFLVKS